MGKHTEDDGKIIKMLLFRRDINLFHTANKSHFLHNRILGNKTMF